MTLPPKPTANLTDYNRLVVQRRPKYAVKPPDGEQWKTKYLPLPDRLVAAHLAGTTDIAGISRWYPEYTIIDFDSVPYDEVVEYRAQLAATDNNSLLFTTGQTPGNYHLLLRPRYKGKPATAKLVNSIFANFTRAAAGLEALPTTRRPVRLPFGKRQELIDPATGKVVPLPGWQEKYQAFQALQSYELRNVPRRQMALDLSLDLPSSLIQGSLSLAAQGREYLQVGLVAPGSRHHAQFCVLMALYRDNYPHAQALRVAAAWLHTKHNGMSKTYPARAAVALDELRRQAAWLYDKGERTKNYPDTTDTNYNGYLCRADLELAIKLAGGNWPRFKFYCELVKYGWPRRHRSWFGIHRDRLRSWAGTRTNLVYLNELAATGLLERRPDYLVDAYSKPIKLNWPTYRQDHEPVLWGGRSVASPEQAIKTCFQPREARELLQAAGMERTRTYRTIQQIFD